MVFKKVFRYPRYWIISGGIAIVLFVLVVWLPNFKLISQMLASSVISFSQKLYILFSLVGSIQISLTTISLATTIAISLLFGINIALVVYYIRERKQSLRSSGMTSGIGGLVSGILGFGCSACGTLLVGSVLGIGGGFLTVLPLGGEEFGLLGVVLLALSTYFLTKRIYQPTVCNV